MPLLVRLLDIVLNWDDVVKPYTIYGEQERNDDSFKQILGVQIISQQERGVIKFYKLLTKCVCRGMIDLTISH